MRIGIDLDEVLCELLRGLVDYYNKINNSSLVFDDFFSYNFWEVWGGDVEGAKDIMFNFYKTDLFEKLKPISGAVSHVKKLSKTHDLFIITARQEIVTVETKAWLDKHFGDLFKDIIIVNHLARSGMSRSKGDVCDELGVDVMIEDSFPYAVDCARNNRWVVLFNKPWNVKEDVPESVVRVDSWDECVKFIDSLN